MKLTTELQREHKPIFLSKSFLPKHSRYSWTLQADIVVASTNPGLSWWFHKESVWNEDKSQAAWKVADFTDNPHPPPEWPITGCQRHKECPTTEPDQWQRYGQGT